MSNKERAREIYKIILREELDKLYAKTAKKESSRVIIRKVKLEELKLRVQEIENYFETLTKREEEISKIENNKARIEQLTKELSDINTKIEQNEELAKQKEALEKEIASAHKKTEPYAKIIKDSGLSATEITRLKERAKERYDIYETIYYKTKKITDIENDKEKSKEKKDDEIIVIASEVLELQKKVKKIEDNMKIDAQSNEKIREVENALAAIYEMDINVRYKQEEYNEKLASITGEASKEIEEKKTEINNLKKEVTESNTKVAKYDAYIEKVNENIEMKGFLESGIAKRETKISKIQAKITELEAMRDKVQSSKEQARITKKINKKKQKIESIKKNKGTIQDLQRIVLLPKRSRFKLGLNQEIPAQARYNVAEKGLQKIEEKTAKLNPETSKIDALKMMIYDLKSAYYQDKKDRAAKVLEEIKNNNKQTTASGGEAVSLPKKTANKLRNKLKQSALNSMTATQQVAPATGRTR